MGYYIMFYFLYTMPLAVVQERGDIGLANYADVVVSSHVFKSKKACDEARHDQNIKQEMIGIIHSHENKNIMTAVPSCQLLAQET